MKKIQSDRPGLAEFEIGAGSVKQSDRDGQTESLIAQGVVETLWSDRTDTGK